MGSTIIQIALFTLGGGILGLVCGWLIQFKIGQRYVAELTGAANAKLDEVTGHRDRFATEYSKARAKIESLQVALTTEQSDSRAKIESLKTTFAQRNSEFESVLKKSKVLATNLVMLRNEREGTKTKLTAIHNALGSLRQQTSTLQSEFKKTQEFFKRELAKSFEKRKLLENQIEEMQAELSKARAEQESFADLIESSSLEHGSSEEMVVAAQLRLGQLQVLERTVSKLEAENEQLNSEVVRLRQEYAAKERDLTDLEELRIHNKQLVQCVEALEESRQGHETDADRYREQADQSEKLSDTLRFKLDDLEKNFADIEKEQGRAIKHVRKAAVVPLLRSQG